MARAQGLPLSASGIFLLAAAVGLAGGLLGVGFQKSLLLFQHLATGSDQKSITMAAAEMSHWRRIVMPAAGGLLAGLFLLLIGNRRGPFGIADTMGLVISRKGTIRIRHSLVQILSSICSISTGGSIGKEGANSQIGATVAAGLARMFKIPSRDRAILLGCGIAAGMSISYNAPIAGGLFVMEVVLGNFAMDVFAPIVVASVLATLVTRPFHLTPAQGLYALGDIPVLDWRLVLSAALLGAVCGAGAIGFRKCLELAGDLFRRSRMPRALVLALAAAGVGAIGIWYPQVWGNGYDVVHSIIGAEWPLSLMFWIMLLKIAATSLSIGSGALGGVFTPTLVVGAALGAGFGGLVESLTSQGGYIPVFALVGMAGLTAAIAHAPITAVILVFELTHGYELILPTMLCAIIASIGARLLDRDSIYTARLRGQEDMLAGGIEALALQTNYVRDIMRADPVRVSVTSTFDEVMETFANTRRDTVYAVDPDGKLAGRIHIHDVKYFLNDPSLTSAVIASDLTRRAQPVTPDQSLASVMTRFDDPDLEELPVVAADDGKLEARITRRDVIAVLSEEVLGQRSMRAKLRAEDQDEDTYVELPAGVQIARVDIPDTFVGRALDSLDLPGEARLNALLVVQRLADGREHRILAAAGTVLEPGASLIVVGSEAAIAAFRAATTPSR